ncbi:MAG: DNA-binding response OmpR family regulator [Alphaproteobacteria bacterium]|jgi:DNA-binding response OmpR family regulator
MTAGRLLIVDDEPDFGEFVRKVAVGMGFEVTVTDRAVAFQQAYKQVDPTVLILDIIMPYTDGIELLMWLADQKCTARIIIATGYTEQYGWMAEILGKAHGLAFETVLNKPMTPDKLRAALTGNS